jgi:hypothetical protein
MKIEPYTRIEHITVKTPDGPIRFHYLKRYDESNISGSHYGLDWWRIPVEPPESRLRRMADKVKILFSKKKQMP